MIMHGSQEFMANFAMSLQLLSFTHNLLAASLVPTVTQADSQVLSHSCGEIESGRKLHSCVNLEVVGDCNAPAFTNKSYT